MAVDVYSYFFSDNEGYNVNNDSYLPIEEFKKKYLTLKDDPDYALKVLHGQNQQHLAAHPEKYLFLAAKFPEYFKLTEKDNSGSTLISRTISYEAMSENSMMLLLNLFANAFWDHLKVESNVLEIPTEDAIKLLQAAIKYQHYWLAYILLNKYKIPEITENNTTEFKEFNAFLNAADEVPWFLSSLVPGKTLNCKSPKYDSNSDLCDLHIAVMYQDERSIIQLLNFDDKFNFINNKDSGGKTALALAVEKKYERAIDLILNCYNQQDAADKEVIRNAIALAYQLGNYKIAKKIATEANFTNEYIAGDLSLLALLARDGHIEELKSYINSCMINDVAHKKVLVEAARCGRVEVVKFILSQEAKIDISDFVVPYVGKRNTIFQSCYDLVYNKWLGQRAREFSEESNSDVFLDDSIATTSFSVPSSPAKSITSISSIAENGIRLTLDSKLSRNLDLSDNDAHKNEGNQEKDEVATNEKNRKSSIIKNETDVIFGDTPLHFAVRAKRVDLIKKFIDQGVDIFAQSRAGLSALEFALEQQYTAGFQYLLNAVSTYPSVRVQTKRYVSCEQLLMSMSDYLATTTVNTEKITFLWNYFGEPFYKLASERDAQTIAYYFKRLLVEAVNHEISKKYENPATEMKSDDNVILARKILAYTDLYQNNTMLALNTSLYFNWDMGAPRSSRPTPYVGWRYYFRKSSQHSKLEELVVHAARTLSVEVNGLHEKINELSQRLNNQHFRQKMTSLIDDLNRSSKKRSEEFGTEKSVSRVFAKAGA